MTKPLTLFDKIWNSHVITTREDETCLLWIDRHLVHDGSFHAFDKLDHDNRLVRRPDLTFGVADHYVPSHARDRPIGDPEAAILVGRLRENAARYGFDAMDMNDPRQGIVHVIGPEQGLTLPGLTLVCGDSHTATHGAFGALAFGIGASEVAHVLATQTLWQRKPRQMRITMDGRLNAAVSAKDVILTMIARIGAAGATGCAIEYTGATVRAMSMAARMTLCNMSIEAGSRTGMIAPDEITFAWVRGRPRAPKGAHMQKAVAAWRLLVSDPDAAFDHEVVIDASTITPTVTWGTSPETALPITGRVPDPAAASNPGAADCIRAQLDAMGLSANQALDGIPIHQVFIGSCTNGRIEDLRAAAAVLRGRSAAIPGLVVAGSMPVKRQAEREGLHRVFLQAGLTWGEPGCSACTGMNGDTVPPGNRCAATSNRNFVGRQGPGSRTHLMSPAMAAAAAATGTICDVRRLIE
ncbi:3-isopropylmalate dehydratase large subunit [Rhodopila sp.]|uniref:3-isopropylmalate dehydratase large subunit n=1 Tax=Rhodopila sp. TaxID=2480087 RepID=UPI003D0F863D